MEQVENFGWGPAWRPDPGVVALVVSELVTNAQRHGGGRIGLSLGLDAGRLRIAVSDGSLRLPVQRPAESGRIGGHGVRIVAELAGGWGVTLRGVGKQVWADLVQPGPVASPMPAWRRRVRSVPRSAWPVAAIVFTCGVRAAARGRRHWSNQLPGGCEVGRASA
ncbi:ATP-binding protein [Streptomyces sp. So13.3]|uniref:ATP-binding protein n=1 Tax=Streptomyces TaxID=1883 RepID=UPI001106E85C|nr:MULTISPECIES: ATP-binding protein [Streptomyces]MCZ4102560.1 ATP-binding protein [Streptomyces sp. H39-C1]QNA77562.1 ATP-binding protein [Streptomyces sp. So13.3]